MLLFTGALTSKPYAFTSRPWELRSVQSIDILDGVGSNIRVDFKESEIVRILPRKNSDVNENWISDKIRFFYDGIKRQRLNSPYIKKSGGLTPLKWKKTLSKFSSVLRVFSFEYGSSSVGVLGGSTLDTGALYALKEFTSNFGFFFCGIDRQFNVNLDNSAEYQFQMPLKNLDGVDYCLVIGSNPRFEASILNLRLRKIFRRGNFALSSVGSFFNTTFPINYLGLSSSTLVDIAEGKHSICKVLAKSKNPVIIYSPLLLSRADFFGATNLIKCVSSIYSKVFGRTLRYNLLNTDSNLVGGFELGIKPLKKDTLKNLKLVYAVGLNDASIFQSLNNKSSSVLVLQDFIGNQYTTLADVVLPMTSFIEQSGIYFNIEGRPQQVQRAFIGPNLSRDSWKITKMLQEFLLKSTAYNTKSQLETKVSKILPAFSFADLWFLKTTPLSFSPFLDSAIYKEKLYNSAFKLFIEDFFMTHSLCFSSSVMAKASVSLRSYSTNYKFLD
jgi:NADH-quinone oxidoreductase subunit G